MHSSEEFRHLLDKYLTNSITGEEKRQLFAMFRERQYLPELEQAVDEALRTQSNTEEDTALREQLFMQVMQQNRKRPKTILRSLLRYAAAAAILAAVVTGIYLLSDRARQPQIANVQHDVAPGVNKAVLTLADGSVVTLDSAGTQVILQGQTAIRQQGGQLQYDVAGSTSAAGYNILTTPRGGQFRVSLPDGTQVWLNAASSLKYPTAFTGSERKVEVTGEAYFEVAKHAQMPFNVKLNEDMEVEVLGTHFNINAYSDEPAFSTTLIEGAVRVVKGKEKAVLKPGQQARLTAGQIDVLRVDTDQAVAWKNGVFNFHRTGLAAAMRQISRWYDVEVVYEKGVPDIEFGGEMERNLSLSQILTALENMGVHFRIEGRKLIVMQ